VAVIVGVTTSEDTPVAEASEDRTQNEATDAGASVPVSGGKFAHVPVVTVPLGLDVGQLAGFAVGHAATVIAVASFVSPAADAVVAAVANALATEPVLVIVIAPVIAVVPLSVPPKLTGIVSVTAIALVATEPLTAAGAVQNA